MVMLAGFLASSVLLSGCGGALIDSGTASGLPIGPGVSPSASAVGAQTTIDAAGNGKSGKTTTDKLITEKAQVAAPSAAETTTKPRANGTAVAPKAAGSSAGSSASKIADTLTASATPGSTAYKIGALDVLDISVFKAPELSKSVQVADSGTVNLPLIEDVQAAGRTAQEIERDIAAKLGAKYLQKPQVTVFVKEYNSQRVTIEGAVKKPGVFPVRGGNTLLQYLAMAEGLDPNSDSTVLVFRTTNGKRSAAKFDINDVRSGAAPDPALVSGDVVVAPSSAMKEAFNNFIKVLPLANVFALL
jgi:polysaccharide biosynthesis/export protein